MKLWQITLKSILNRKGSSLIALLSIAFSVALLLSVERLRRSAEQSFTQSISQTDLIVGARSGPINLALYALFNIGSATNNISWSTYERFKSEPAVKWTIPMTLGDGHRGFRVVGTNQSFFEHFRFRQNKSLEFSKGEQFEQLWDVVIGSEVASRLNYNLGQKIVIAHGVTRGEGILMHDDKPFTVTGVLKPTGTPVDQSIYISLEGFEALHIDWESGAQPTKDKMIPASAIKEEELKPQTLTAFFVGLNSRIEVLRLQRAINTFSEEPLTAIIPGVTLSDLWRTLGAAEKVLKVISIMVMAVSLLSLLLSLLASLNERRREMSVLRSLGAGPSVMVTLILIESAILTLLGTALGVLLSWLVYVVMLSWLESQYGFFVSGGFLSSSELLYLGFVLIAGVLTGLIPALRSMSLALKDGLAMKV